MVRISGVNIPDDKRAEIGLTYIHGVGRSLAKQILSRTEIDPDTQVKDLSEDEVGKIRGIIEKNYRVEGELKRIVSENIKRLKQIGCYRGLRHQKGLPVRGQRTRTNARTRKGKKKTIGLLLRDSKKKGQH